MKWQTTVAQSSSRGFRNNVVVPCETPDLWWLAFRRRRAKFAAVPTRALVKAAARGYRSIVVREPEFVLSVDE